MNIKSVLIPVAAFAVTVSGVSAFNSDLLERAGLTEEQISAFETAKELREQGDNAGARDILKEAGITTAIMESIREAVREFRLEHREAVKEAVENNDYEAFIKAAAGSPLAEIVDTKEEFAKFVEAHNLMKNGDKDSAKAIFDDLGIEGPGERHGPFGAGKEFPFMDKLTDEQKVEIKAAFEARDHEKVKAILEAAGIELPDRSEGKGFGFGRGDKRDKDSE